MFAHELISDFIPPVRTSDTVQKVLDRMHEFHVSHLPIVNDKQFIGLISDTDLSDIVDHTSLVGSLSLSLYNPFVFEDQHIYDTFLLFYEQNLSVVPVLDNNKNYKGLISVSSVLKFLATLSAVKDPGGIIVLEVDNRNNSMAHIAQIVESDNAQILSSYVRSFTDSTKLEITIKLNRTDISSIIASFLRYDYHVKATFSDSKSDNGTADRYNQLMNYLDI